MPVIHCDGHREYQKSSFWVESLLQRFHGENYSFRSLLREYLQMQWVFMSTKWTKKVSLVFVKSQCTFSGHILQV
jgi:hypothetical protein